MTAPSNLGSGPSWAGETSSDSIAISPAGGGILVAIGFGTSDSDPVSAGTITTAGGWSGTAPTWSVQTPVVTGSGPAVGIVLACSTNAYSGSGTIQTSWTGANLTGIAVVELTDSLTFTEFGSAAGASSVNLTDPDDYVLASFFVFGTTDHDWSGSGLSETFDANDSAFGAVRSSVAYDDSSPGDPSATPTSGTRVMAAMSFGTAGGGAIDLVVADLAVASTIDAPTLTQVHTLAVADVAIASTIDAPALTQVHDLTVADLAVVTSIGTPTLVVNLNVTDLTIATTIDSPALTQVHELTVADLQVATTIDTPALVVDLAVADLTVATSIDAPALTQVHDLVVADLAVASTIDAPSLTQVHTLNVADLAIGVTIDSPTLTQTHELAVADLGVATTIDSPTLQVGGINLTVADLALPVSIETPTLTQVHQLTVAALTVDSTVDAPALTQVHELVVAGLDVAVTIETPTLEVASINLVVADLAVASTVDSPALTQVHQLVVADLAVVVTIDVVTIGGPTLEPNPLDAHFGRPSPPITFQPPSDAVLETYPGPAVTIGAPT